MSRTASRCVIGLALLAAVLVQARGQEREEAPRRRAPDEVAGGDQAEARKAEQERKSALREAEDAYRQFFKRPETVFEFWAAMKFEMNVGKFNLAAEYLKGFLDQKPTDQQLLQIEEEDGMSAFLRLLSIPELRKDARPLVERVTKVVQQHLANPERVTRFIRSLSAPTEEERLYALEELRRTGPAAVPYFIAALRETAGTPRHMDVLESLERMRLNATPAIVAALDTEDAALRLELAGVVRRRRDPAAVPYLWYLSASPKQSETLRREATETLALLLAREPGRLPPAKEALTREARRYYDHQVRFVPADAVTVWEWEGRKLVSRTMAPGQAEEYFGLRFARQAIDLDPSYEPAQVVFLSLALDKGAPDVGRLLDTVRPRLLLDTLDKALAEHRLPVILGVIRALGERQEAMAVRPTGQWEPALLRALYYPDHRVRLAAADALLRMPDQPVRRAAPRIVEVLRRTISADAAPKVIVADFDQRRAQTQAAAIEEAGFQTEIVPTGRQLLRRLAAAGDVDAVFIDHQLPDPGLPQLLGRLRADADVGHLPVFVTVFDASGNVPPGEQRLLEALTAGYRNVHIAPLVLDPATLKREIARRIAEAGGRALSDPERKHDAGLALVWLGQIAAGHVPGYDIRPAQDAILKGLGTPDLAALAADAAGNLPGRAAQFGLARLLLTGKDAEARAAAARALVHHIQEYGSVLSAQEVGGIENLYNATDNAKLKASVALVLGALRPDVRETARRLQAFPAPTAAPPPPREAGPPGESR